MKRRQQSHPNNSFFVEAHEESNMLIHNVHRNNEKVATAIFLMVLAIVLFIAAAALMVMHTLHSENEIRIALVQDAARLPNAHETIVTMPPIELKNRALRHIFFEDFSNGVTKDGLCRYYGIKDIKVK